MPYADGALLPLAAVLTAFGLAFNYRLDPDDGGRQALWVLIGVGVFSATLVALRHDYRVLESYRYLFGVAAVLLLLLPSVPGARRRGERRAAVGRPRPAPVPARRAREDLPDPLPRGIPAREARGARAGPAEGLRARCSRSGARRCSSSSRRTTSGARSSTSGSSSRCSTSRPARRLYVGAGLALFVGGAAILYNVLDRVHERVTIWLQPWTDERDLLRAERRAGAPAGLRLVPARARACTRSGTAASAGRASAEGTFRATDGSRADPGAQAPTSSTRRSRRSSG